MITTIRRAALRLLLATAAAQLTAQARPDSRVAPPGGLVYRATRADRDTLFLVGSVHLVDSAHAAVAHGLRDLVRRAHTVVFELDLDSAAAQMPAAIRVGLAPAGSSLWRTVTPATDTVVRAFLGRVGIAPDAVASLKPWLLGIQITGLAGQAAHLLPDLGLDRAAFQLAKQEGRAVVGLETAAEQLGIFDAMSAADQDSFLRNAVVQFDSMATQSRALLDAWQAGDASRVDALSNGRLAKYPAAKRALVDERNARWIPQLDALAARRTGAVTVVVGAAHLTGEGGVVALLTKAGYRVTAQ